MIPDHSRLGFSPFADTGTCGRFLRAAACTALRHQNLFSAQSLFTHSNRSPILIKAERETKHPITSCRYSSLKLRELEREHIVLCTDEDIESNLRCPSRTSISVNIKIYDATLYPTTKLLHVIFYCSGCQPFQISFKWTDPNMIFFLTRNNEIISNKIKKGKQNHIKINVK